MTISIPHETASLIHLVLTIGLAVASLGLTCSLLASLLSWLPANSSLRLLTSLGEHRLAAAKPWRYTAIALWSSVTAMHWLGWQIYLVEESPNRLHILGYTSSLIAILLSWQFWVQRSSGAVAAKSTMVMRCAQVGGLFCCVSLFPASDTKPLSLTPPGTLVACQVAHTDQGTPISLYSRQVAEHELAAFYADTGEQTAAMARNAMFRVQPQPHINCHGWVFTSQFIIKGEDVATIIRENGYQEVDKPQLKDLVIYHNAAGHIIHTGIICGFLADETALVESKWGAAGTYMHLANEQPYSQNYHFYRSPRQGHQLRYSQAAIESLAHTENNCERRLRQRLTFKLN